MPNRKSGWHLPFFILLSMLLYVPLYKYGNSYDFLGWIHKYANGNFGDVIHCFEYNGLHQVFHFFNYLFYSLFDTHPLAWSLCFALLHGINGYLVFCLGVRLHSNLSSRSSTYFRPALLAAILFVISPYQFEVLTWNACMHYLLVTLFNLSALLCLLGLRDEKDVGRLLLFHILTFASFFILEMGLAAPFIAFAFLLFMDRKRSVLFKIGKVLVPQICLIVLYFLMNKWILGDYIGHYGAEKHMVFDVKSVFGHGIQYFAKHSLLIHFLPLAIKTIIYSWIISIPGMVLSGVICTGLLLLLIKKWNSFSPHLKISSVCLIAFFMALVPIVNLYFYYQDIYENNRYSYFALSYFSLFIIYLLWSMPKLGKVLSVFLLILSTGVSTYVHQVVREAASFQHSLLQTFDACNSEDELFFLTLPENYRGVYLFGDFYEDANSFKKSLHYLYDKPCDQKTNLIAFANQNNISDGFYVTQKGEGELEVGISQGGNWFLKNRLGLKSSENERYSLTVGPWYYRVKFKEPKANQLFLWHEGQEWKSFRWGDKK